MAVMTVMIRLVVAVVSERRVVRAMTMSRRIVPRVHGCGVTGVSLRGNAFHRDGRKRLSRQAQCQQHDDEEFAPI